MTYNVSIDQAKTPHCDEFQDQYNLLSGTFPGFSTNKAFFEDLPGLEILSFKFKDFTELSMVCMKPVGTLFIYITVLCKTKKLLYVLHKQHYV